MRNSKGPRIRASMVACVLMLGASVSSPSKADMLHASRSELLQEVSHRIEVSVDRGHATLVARRTVFNGGPRPDQAIFFLNVPDGAVAVGLRSLGYVGGRPQWFAGQLMEAETAAERYRELTGLGVFQLKDPALLYWRSGGNLGLQVFPCEAGTNKTVEYTLIMPTKYREGRYRFSLPRLGTENLAATVTLRPANPADRLFVGDALVRPGTEVSLAGDDYRQVSLELPQPSPISGALAVLPLSTGRTITNARIEVARQLSTVPSRARVVVLLDSSHSLGEAERTAMVEGAQAYLSHFSDATAEVIPFDRTARPVNGRLVPVAKAIEDLASLKLTPANGSAVDAALERAASLLAVAPAGERRVVIFTDTLTRVGLASEQLNARFGAVRGIVHVAVPHRGAWALERNDHHDWSEGAKSTGGLVWAARVQETDVVSAKAVLLELARPVRLHNVQIRGGFLSESVTSIETLAEGEGVADLEIGSPAGNFFTAEGELWTRRVSTRTAASESESKRWAAMIFGTHLHESLSDQEMMTLAMRGGAVSPVTSYLAIEPGVRPSTEGLEEGEGIGLGGIGTLGFGMGAGGASIRLGHPFDHQGWLQNAISSAWATCGGPPEKLHVSIETTRSEIVDVPKVLSESAAGSVVSCMREAVWQLDLPNEFRGMRASWQVGL